MAFRAATLISRIPEIIGEIPGAVTDAMRATADAVADGARERVPVDSGSLRDAIHVEEIPDGFRVVAGDTEAFYGHIVEHGGTRTPPRPFLVPALEAERENHRERVSEALEDL